MTLQRASRPVAHCLRQSSSTRHARTLATTPIDPSSTDAALPPPSDPLSRTRNPFTASTPAAEKQLAQQKQRPIGSRRRRAALSSTTQIPFTQLPYQAFQEARAFLQEDRREKLEAIGLQRVKIARLQDRVVVGEQNGEVERRKQREKDNRVRSMGRRLEEMKVMADINDPMVKKRFEDGQGRHLTVVIRGRVRCNLLIVYGTIRRHDQTYLPPPGQHPMALLQTPNPPTTTHSNECHA